MTNTRIYFNPHIGVIMLIETEEWFDELSSREDLEHWHYIGFFK